MNNAMHEDRSLIIAGKHYHSRLLVGSGKYRDLLQTREATEAAGAEIITVAIRRVNIGQNPNEPSLQLARELLGGHKLVKLEVLGDEKTLFPNMPETLRAAEILVRDGFDVMVYCSDDPIQAKMLEEIGCVAVMPLASLIGSGMGILNPWNLSLIIEQAKVPVLVDAGVGTASDAAIAMELGCDGVLMNSAIALSRDPVRMARAMRLAVEAGREAYLAGRMAPRFAASPSSPMAGRVS
jgi:thiazole synthase